MFYAQSTSTLCKRDQHQQHTSPEMSKCDWQDIIIQSPRNLQMSMDMTHWPSTIPILQSLSLHFHFRGGLKMGLHCTLVAVIKVHSIMSGTHHYIWYTGLCLVHSTMMSGAQDCLVQRTMMSGTQDYLWYTGLWCLVHSTMVSGTHDYDVWYTGLCLVHTMSGTQHYVWYTEPWCLVHRWSGYDVWYTELWYLVQRTMMSGTHNYGIWYRQQWCLVHRTMASGT